MNLGITIKAVQARWASAFPDVPLYLKLAPETTPSRYAVMLWGSVASGEPTTEEKNYLSQVTFFLFAGSCPEIISLLDGISDAFGSQPFDGITMIEAPDAIFNIDFTDRDSPWDGEITFSIQWSKPRR